MVFQKDLTPFAKGGTVKKHRGKGSSIPRPDPVGRMTGRYPKVAPVEPVEPVAPMGPTSMAPPMRLPPDEV